MQMPDANPAADAIVAVRVLCDHRLTQEVTGCQP